MNLLKKYLPKNLKKKLRRLFDSLAGYLGYTRNLNTNVSFHKNTLLDTLFINVKTMGFYPKHIIDVGAKHGSWTRETLNYFPDAYYTLLEPQRWSQSSFQDLLNEYSNITMHAFGAGAESGSIYLL